MCCVGVSNEGRSSFTATRLSNGCNWLFDEAPIRPCHALVHFEGKMSHFRSKLVSKLLKMTTRQMLIA